MATKRTLGRPNAVEQLVGEVQSQFVPIDIGIPQPHRLTIVAQQRLGAAISAVNNMLLSMNLWRAVDRHLKKKDLRGRLSDSEQDILRAVITFAGAGLDAALKKLIKDSVREIASHHELARKKFLDYVERHLSSADSVINRRSLGEILIDGRGSQAALLDRYERELTGDSLQSSRQVSLVCGALGVDDRDIRERDVTPLI